MGRDNQKVECPYILGFMILSIFFALIIGLFLKPYIKISFIYLYLVSLVSFWMGYIMLILRYYNLKSFYVVLSMLFLLGVGNYYFHKLSIFLPDPSRYAAAYIVIGVLVGIGVSIAFIYAFSTEEE